jgi:flagellar L-ring protein precursor FlgH
MFWSFSMAMHRIGYLAAAVIVGASFANLADAQSSPAQRNPAGEGSQPVTPATPATPSQTQASPQPIDALIQRGGGSLMRLQLRSQPAGPNTGTVNAVSFYAVMPPVPKTLHKHDLVTIIVNEQSAFSSNGTTDLKHTNDLDMIIDSYLQLKLSNLSLNEHLPTTPLELKTSGARDFKGTADVDRTDSFTARITASVVDVKPNGTMVLQATKRIKTDEEEQVFTMTGTCRVEDIAADGTVLSTQLYGLDLVKKHTGAVRDTTTRGLIPRLLDYINPF